MRRKLCAVGHGCGGCGCGHAGAGLGELYQRCAQGRRSCDATCFDVGFSECMVQSDGSDQVDAAAAHVLEWVGNPEESR